MLLKETIDKIGVLDQKALARARSREDSLTKPTGSLGILEDIAVKIAGITGNPLPWLERKAVITIAGDHGVVAEGVSAYPQEVTPQMVHNFLNGGAAINVLSRHAGAKVVCADLGMVTPVDDPRLIVKRIGPGTKDIMLGAAMTREEAVKALEAGIEIASEQIKAGIQLLATGDMGIGNTTPSTAILAAFTGFPVAMLTGMGTGIADPALQHKVQVIEKSLEVNHPDPRDGIEVLAKVGGFEIGGLAGVILAAAAARVPVVVDGFISGAAAMIAKSIAPGSVNFMIASHLSEEPGHRVMMDWLGLKPVIHANMRLGEGTGAVLTFTLIDASLKILREMATFAEAGVIGDKVC